MSKHPTNATARYTFGKQFLPKRFTPENCPHCEADRRVFGHGGWIEQPNNGPIVSCPVCNPSGEGRS